MNGSFNQSSLDRIKMINRWLRFKDEIINVSYRGRSEA